MPRAPEPEPDPPGIPKLLPGLIGEHSELGTGSVDLRRQLLASPDGLTPGLVKGGV